MAAAVSSFSSRAPDLVTLYFAAKYAAVYCRVVNVVQPLDPIRAGRETSI
jgi:hypothetical protein